LPTLVEESTPHATIAASVLYYIMNVITDNSDTSDSKAPKITISWISLGVRIGSLVVDSYFILPAHSEEHIFNTLVALSMLMLPLEA
jgi:hypothetical protein